MDQITTIGIDLAKTISQIHSVDGSGKIILQKAVKIILQKAVDGAARRKALWRKTLWRKTAGAQARRAGAFRSWRRRGGRAGRDPATVGSDNSP